jgi:hypothetical protein
MKYILQRLQLEGTVRGLSIGQQLIDGVWDWDKGYILEHVCGGIPSAVDPVCN